MLSTRRVLVAGGLVLTALLVGVASLVAVNAMARQTVQEEHSYAFTGKALSIDAAIGDVHIVPGKAGTITVARRLTYGLRRPFVEERLDGDTFRVSDRRCTPDVAFACEVRWLLQVPSDVDVEVTTVSGSINVSGMGGTVKLASETGSVRALAPSGKLVTLRSKTGLVLARHISSEQVVATSTKGAVSLIFRAPPSLVVGRSETGNVGIVLPDGDESYRIEAKSSQDRLRTVTAKDDPHSKRRITSAPARATCRCSRTPPASGSRPGNPQVGRRVGPQPLHRPGGGPLSQSCPAGPVRGSVFALGVDVVAAGVEADVEVLTGPDVVRDEVVGSDHDVVAGTTAHRTTPFPPAAFLVRKQPLLRHKVV